MKIQKNELLEAINKVKPGLSKKEIIEQASHLIFAEGELATFNDQICIIHPFACDFSFSVKGDDFIKVLNSIATPEFDMTLEDNILKIKAKGTRSTLSTIVGEEAKVEHLIAQIKKEISAPDFFKPLPKEFIDGVYLCAFSANKDVATGVRSCVAVSGDAIYATDNIRASNYLMDKSMDDMLLPAKDAMELCKYKVVEYGISENWLHFRTEGGIVFNCKTMKGDYPLKKVQAIFADAEAEISFPEGLQEIVSSVTALAEGDMDINKTVLVEVSKGSIKVTAEKERGKIERDMDFDYKGEPIKFIINPIFFAQILQHATGFVLIDGLAQFSSDNFYHVMSLPTEG